MSVLISLCCSTVAGALLGAALTLRWSARRPCDAGRLVHQVRAIRSEVAELATLYARPSTLPNRADQPRGTVTRLIS